MFLMRNKLTISQSASSPHLTPFGREYVKPHSIYRNYLAFDLGMTGREETANTGAGDCHGFL